MALNTFKCNYLTPLHFKGLMTTIVTYNDTAGTKNVTISCAKCTKNTQIST